jgi:hypothetical protein
VGILLLDPETPYRPAIEGGFGLFPVKVDLSPDKLLRFVFREHPPAAFPYLVSQLGEIVGVFDQMDLHGAHS